MLCLRWAVLLVVWITTFAPLCHGAEFTCKNINISNGAPAVVPPVLNKTESALILLLGFGGVSVFLALLYIGIRRYVFDDSNNLDSTFDAGGNVSASLTAVTIAAQLLWPADLMQSVTVAVKYGVAGVFWYCAAVLLNLSLFPLLSFKFKTKAPGAKTYLQIILARCGRKAHTVFCVFALLVNLVILASILVGGIAVLQTTIKDVSPEYCIVLLAALCGCYSMIGGLGSTFYVSYFNAATTFVVLSVLVINVFWVDDLPFGSLEEIYDKINCLPGPSGNRDKSYFTFLSEGGILWAVQGVFVVSSITYCDQASWQSRIAAKPMQGALGFLLAGIIWFACPSTIGTVAGLTYLALIYDDPSKQLSQDQINSGIVSAYMSGEALGKQGGVMMLTMLTMLTMSTGSGEIMGISSIIVYDIYQPYIRPYRFQLPKNHCIFCGQRKENSDIDVGTAGQAYENSVDGLCKCPPALTCDHCETDLERLNNRSKSPGKIVQYECPYHGDYRTYQDSLINFKNWCILWVTLALIPYGLALHAAGLDLNWTMMTGIVLTVPCFPGVILCIVWVKLTGYGLIVGSLVGLVCGVMADLLVAFLHFEGDGGFLVSTSELYSVVAGAGSGMFVSFFLTVVVSLYTHKIHTKEDEEEEWSKMFNIDNALHPWALNYAKEYPEVKDGIFKPTSGQLEHIERHGRTVSIIGSIVFTVIFIIVIPGIMASLEVLSASEFRAWTTVIVVWCFVMAVIIILVTPIEEVRAIYLQLKAKRHRKYQSQPADSFRLKEEGEFNCPRGNGDATRERQTSDALTQRDTGKSPSHRFDKHQPKDNQQGCNSGTRGNVTTIF